MVSTSPPHQWSLMRFKKRHNALCITAIRYLKRSLCCLIFRVPFLSLSIHELHATISRSCCLLRGHKLLHQWDHSWLRACLTDIRELWPFYQFPFLCQPWGFSEASLFRIDTEDTSCRQLKDLSLSGTQIRRGFCEKTCQYSRINQEERWNLGNHIVYHAHPRRPPIKAPRM